MTKQIQTDWKEEANKIMFKKGWEYQLFLKGLIQEAPNPLNGFGTADRYLENNAFDNGMTQAEISIRNGGNKTMDFAYEEIKGLI